MQTTEEAATAASAPRSVTRVLHIADSTTSWDATYSLAALIERLPSDAHPQSLVATDRNSLRALTARRLSPILIGRPLTLGALAAPRLERYADEIQPDLIHAWGPRAAATAAAAGGLYPIVVSISDPSVAQRDAKLLRTLCETEGTAICTPTERARRTAVESGCPFDQTVVIRPGIDFRGIGEDQRSDLRKRLDADPGDLLLLLPPLGAIDGAADDAVKACSLLTHAGTHATVVLPADHAAAKDAQRLAKELKLPGIVRIAPKGARTEALIASADAVLVAPTADAPSAAAAWAMAARTLVIGSATYAVAELIGSGMNGILFKRTAGQPCVVDIAKAMSDRDRHAKLIEAAHGQAFEVFGMRRFLDQHTKLYANMLTGSAPSDDITDAAMTNA